MEVILDVGHPALRLDVKIVLADGQHPQVVRRKKLLHSLGLIRLGRESGIELCRQPVMVVRRILLVELLHQFMT